ncbi:hypothetical protein MYK68_15980 [Gordonia sp. PP30]|uniref:hypothetical protein n=1 Tax=Gordonia sp. PP30 TaxID=2935861 RepID=UPI001FFF7CEE|nr:hypothetical protein [Gordonia sp. PP30]UQE74210.1 hypothetical protein MYK68_15980 [Gordonia sp. PP30]
MQHVNMWIEDELQAAARSDHRKVLDEDGCSSLHEVARKIYALGVHDGCVQQSNRDTARRHRERIRAEDGAL